MQKKTSLPDINEIEYESDVRLVVLIEVALTKKRFVVVY